MREQGLLEERLQLFRDTVQMKKTNKIPNVSNFWTWKILDSEYKLSEAMLDWDKMFKLVCDFQERYNFDAHMDLGTRNPIAMINPLGEHFYQIDDEKEIINVDDITIMNGDEYDELKTNPTKFYWTKALPRRYPNITIENLKKSMFEFGAFNNYSENISNIFREKYQSPLILDRRFILMFGFDMLFNFLRGMKELSSDLRRHKSEMLEVLDVMYEMSLAPTLKAAMLADTSDIPFDTSSVILGHSILNVKQFEELYWPTFKKVFDNLAENGKTMYLFCESEMMRFYEFFQEVPKGCLAIHLEQDNIFDMRKKLPNICFVGGMTTDLLGNGTPDQCVNYAKRLIDELGQDGGYIFSQNKMMSFRNDCKRENLLAVNEVVRNYRG
ncbi:hypothetical protein GC105_13070 [Alkalibaculum sp. M08DMB]|uniref:Uroporphyrinogen decarboxylase (URO-D) domain-containing protein n=1 Tax=Alkalibaculum sporogenes TaxID=2655001 RepID=A0A6A7KB15_9FIRM|nr:uroporphyrinogen decarboxylase family protein [Alkalibaculum sporogenes]MPW26720.1 hypothetical protein [Alkalibaculum sporogenes]